MVHTVYQPAELPPSDAAHGHWPRDGGGHIDHTRGATVIPFMAAASAARAAGAIASTAGDLVIWADALYGGDVLSRRSLREMTTFLPEGTYGLGTDEASFAGHRGYGHRGGLRGFEASMWYFPREGVSAALLANQGNWDTDAPMERIVKAVLGRPRSRSR
jgi:CubicO group peptidase (beta-lactamase class C family)